MFQLKALISKNNTDINRSYKIEINKKGLVRGLFYAIYELL